jgi:glycosyltransferase involved in cell wall biosynthesis
MALRKCSVAVVVGRTFAIDFRVRPQARALASHGFDVRVLCWDRQGRRPSTEFVDQCLVRNIRFGKTAALAFSRLYRLYYVISALFFQVAILLWVVRQIGRARTLLLHAHDFNTLLGCVAASELFKDRVRLVYDCHELTPGVYKEWYGSLISAIVGRLEFAALSRVNAIVAANEAIHRHLSQQSRARGVVIYNCPAIGDIPRIRPLDAKNKLGLRNFFVVLFSGQVRQDYDFSMMLDAARDLMRGGLSNFRFVFTGPLETSTFLRDAVSNEGLEDLFDFRGWVSSEDLMLYYIASDLSFAVTRDVGPNAKILTPVKLFESMACGVPVVVRDGTLAAHIVREWRCGIVVHESTAFSAELIRLSQQRHVLRALGAAGQEAFRLEYNWDHMQCRLLQLYAELQCSNP